MGVREYLQNQVDNAHAHPVQTALAQFAGAFVPGGSMLAGRAFQAYNNRNFNNAATANVANVGAQGNRAGEMASSGIPWDSGSDASPYGDDRQGFQDWASSTYNPQQNTDLLDFLGPNTNGPGGSFANGTLGQFREGGSEGGDGGMVEGGGSNGSSGNGMGGWNGASSQMMTDFAAPDNGAWEQHEGVQRVVARRVGSTKK